jgi:hypothetical protein
LQQRFVFVVGASLNPFRNDNDRLTFETHEMFQWLTFNINRPPRAHKGIAKTVV